MCQTTSGKRSSRLSPPFPIPGRHFVSLRTRDSSMDIRYCPVMGKLSILTDEERSADNFADSGLSPSAPIHDDGNQKHKCFVCARFQEEEAAESPYSKSHLLKSLPAVLSVLRRSTQPAHLVVMTAVIVLAMVFYPASKRSFTQLQLSSDSSLWPLLYLASFSTLFGAQMWMTFVSGLVLLFILPRHTFACVQSALFPKYMILNGVAAFTALTAFLHIQQQRNSWSLQDYYQVLGLAINCLFPLVARVLVVPNLLKRIQTKVLLERAAGHGPEAGPKLATATGELLKQCSVYQRTCLVFRRLHAVIAIVNIVTLAFNAFHLYYLASKISFQY